MKHMKRWLLYCLIGIASVCQASLTVNNGGGATNITSTSAWLHATVVSTGAADPGVYIFYGTNNAGSNTAGWITTNYLGLCTQTTYRIQATGLPNAILHYYRVYATNGSETNWSSISALFRTLSAPTSVPAASVESVTVDTNDMVKHPTNLWVANKTNIIIGIGALTNVTYGTTSASAYRGDWGNAVSSDLDTAEATVSLHTGQIGAISQHVDLIQSAQTAVSNQVNINTTNALLLTGIRAMQSNLNMGGFSITNVADSSIVFTNGQSLTAAKIVLYDLYQGQIGSVSQHVDLVQSAQTAISNQVDLHTGQIGAISNDLNTAESTIDLHTSQIGAVSNQADVARAIADGLNSQSTTWATVVNKLNLAGGVMTGPLTNNSLIAGNGAGITNLAANYFQTAIPVTTTNLLTVGTLSAHTNFFGAANIFCGAFDIQTLAWRDYGNFVLGNFYDCPMDIGANGNMIMGRGVQDSIFITNVYGSIALPDNSGNILITNDASIVLGNGNSLGSRSILADIISARNSLRGNGAAVSNVNATNATSLGSILASTWSSSTSAINTAVNGHITADGVTNPAQLTALGFVTNPLSANLDVNNKELTNVTAITLGGDRQTAWPVATVSGTNWSKYIALQNINGGGFVYSNASYKGDGANLTNILSSGVILTNYPKLTDGAVTNPVGANINLNGKDVTNAGVVWGTNLRITGSSPTTGAVMIATNSLGETTWNVYPKIAAENTTAFTMANSTWTKIAFPTTLRQISGTWDGTNWTPGVIGWIAVNSLVTLDTRALTGRTMIMLRKNNIGYQYQHETYLSASAAAVVSGSFLDYCDINTNSYSIWVNTIVGSTTTNSDAYFFGVVNP